MNERTVLDSLPPEVGLWGNVVCNRFEAAWREGQRPPIAEYLADAPESVRSALLNELILLDLEYRRRLGETPQADDYRPLFPVAPPAWLTRELDSGVRAGRYHLGDEIGRGSMGVVYRAHDPDLDRDLAVKVLHERYRDHPEAQARFLKEAHLTARLQHPNIVPVHEQGRLGDGRPFFAMKLVYGQTLDRLLSDRPSPLADLSRFLRVFAQVGQAVGYAHSRGVIHRDLKPSNVMVGAFGEVQVMDWGLCKVLSDSDGAEVAPPSANGLAGDTLDFAGGTPEPLLATQLGAALGTYPYMPPEQARGEVGQIDPRCDVFSLGAILCTILTGEPPYTRGSDEEMKCKAKGAELAEAWDRLDNCGADAELLQLTKACLAADRTARPADAGAVAAAVAVYQSGVEDRLRRAELDRAAAEVKAGEERKRRRLTAALAVAGLLLVCLAGGTAWRAQQASAARKAENTVRQTETAGKVRAALKQATTLIEQGWNQGEDLEQWGTTLDAADHALALAEELVNSSEATDEVRAEVRAVEAQLKEAKAHRSLASAIDATLIELLDAGPTFEAYTKATRELPRIFQDCGVDLFGPDRERAIRWAVTYPRRTALLGLLTAWSVWTRDANHRQRLLDLLGAVDPELQSKHLRWALALAMMDGKTLATLSSDPQVDKMPPPALVLMGAALNIVGEPETAVQLLKRGLVRYPDDFWLNLRLGIILLYMKPPRTEEAIRHIMVAVAVRKKNALAYSYLGRAFYQNRNLNDAIAAYRTAVQLDAQSGYAHRGLGDALRDAKNFPDAIKAYHKAIECEPKDGTAYNNLGLALQANDQLGEAIKAYRKATDCEPKWALPHNNLGAALHAAGNFPAAIEAFRKATDCEPRNARFHDNLGIALKSNKDLPGAIDAFRKALEYAPDDPNISNRLGNALQADGQFDEAIAVYRKAIARSPKYEQPHYNLGLALKATQDLPGAIAAFRKAIECAPKYARAHYSLGLALRDANDLPGAVAAFHKAIEYDSRFVHAYRSLGQTLLLQGRFDEARTAARRVLELLPRQDPLYLPATAELEKYEQMQALDPKLPALIRGEIRAKDAKEQLVLAELCQLPSRRYYAAAARFYETAFTAEPKLADDLSRRLRSAAARAAALAGDDATLSDEERADLRQRALGWLQADLTAWAKLAQGASSARVREALRDWKQEPDLAGVRDEKALRRLPDAERKAWEALWAEVDRVLSRLS